LGSDKPPAVRIAGAYAIAGLADDWEDSRQACIDVLCGYLRMPYPQESGSREKARVAFLADREVRHTVIRVIVTNLRDDAKVSWQGRDFDFTGVVFDGGDFSGAVFSGGWVRFTRARFTGGKVDFVAQFSGAFVDFTGAEFSGGQLNFGDTKFSGGKVSFDHAKFSCGIASFRGARLNGAEVSFHEAECSDGRVDFTLARFSGGIASFLGAKFSGSQVFFMNAEFTGGLVLFQWVKFSDGQILFELAEFCDGCFVAFLGCVFSGAEVTFNHAKFSGGKVVLGTKLPQDDGSVLRFGPDETFRDGVVKFDWAKFCGAEVSFAGAGFTGGEVDFHAASDWSKPPVFDWDSPPPGVKLPIATGAESQ
jgi:uncharacterized protein YjbI with pentapeptide repeats